MEDKNYDDFFDEKTVVENPQKELMKMVDTIDKSPDLDLEVGAKVTGKILTIGKEYVYVDIGQRNEAVLKKEEVTNNEGNVTVTNDDSIEAFVISTDNNEIVISKSLSGRKAKTKELIGFMKDKIPVDGKVTGVNKGGFNVSIMGRKAFCPFSHIDLKYIDTPNAYLSKTYSFVITQVENRGRNIVLSRLPILEKDLSAKIDALEARIKNKEIGKGTISKITKFGLFVDLGDIEGLVHISEVSWDRIENLKGTFKVGQTIEYIVKEIKRKEPLRNSKISLSIRQMDENPWIAVSEKLSVGSVVEGTISNLTSFGAFVQLFPGIEGLVHISEMSWGKRVRHPSEIVSKGQSVKVTILAVDEEKQSVSCSLKDIADNPWNDVTEKYPVGSKASGTVASETKYGFFIDLDEYITGLLVHTKVAKDKKGTIKKGDTIEVTIDEIDVENNRISLSFGDTKAPEAAVVSSKQSGKSQKQAAAKKSTSEFGDLLKAAMNKKES
jgi:small subunit ribosomal protein S1